MPFLFSPAVFLQHTKMQEYASCRAIKTGLSLQYIHPLAYGVSMLKKLSVGFIALVVLIGVGGYFLTANLDSLIRTAVEKYGSAATQTAVGLDNVTLALSSGEGALSGLSVGTPEGFAADKSLYLGNISIKVNTSSLTGSGPIVIHDITIDKPQITYEINQSGQSNLQVLARNAQSYAASLGGEPKKDSPKTASPDTEKPGRKIIIEKLTIRNGQIAINQPLLQGKQLSASLPLITLSNIGKNSDGAAPAEVIEKIMGAVTSSAAQVARSSLAKELGPAFEKAKETVPSGMIEGLGSEIKGLFGE